MNIANNLPKSNILDFVVSAMKYIKLSSSLTAGIIGLTVLVTVCTIGTQLSLASIDLPSNNLPTSDFKDPRQDAYDGCLSRLTDKMQEDKAASTCFDYVYGRDEGEQETDDVKDEDHDDTESEEDDESESEDQIMVVENRKNS